jgi:hypothetical protein
MPIDTLAYVKTLPTAGVDEKVAEAHMEAMRTHVLPEIASKRDAQDLKAEIERVRLLVESFTPRRTNACGRSPPLASWDRPLSSVLFCAS